MNEKIISYLKENLILIISFDTMKDDNGKICYARTTEGGHDKCPIPFEFITEDEKDWIIDEIHDDLISEFDREEADEIYDYEDEIIDLIKELSEKDGK